MRIGDVMTSRVETVPAGESAENALRRMRAKRIHHLVVPLEAGAVGVSPPETSIRWKATGPSARLQR